MTSKRIVITGVSRGLGRSLVNEFIALGHRVAGCARNEKSIDDLNNQHGSSHHFTCVDVIDDSAVGHWSQELLENFGTPDLLINNAALINANSPLWEVSAEEFGALIDVNIKGVHSVIRHLLPAMLKSGSGVVVNLSSGWGRSVSPDVAPYCATKWAIEGMTKALAEELPPGMAAVPLSPGTVNTEMLQSCFGPSADQHLSPEDWAKTAGPFMIGLSASHNGQSLTTP